jgi:hypothetical protein
MDERCHWKNECLFLVRPVVLVEMTAPMMDERCHCMNEWTDGCMDRCSSFVQLASVIGPATRTAGPLRVSGWTEKGRNHGTETTSLPIIHARTNERTNECIRPSVQAPSSPGNVRSSGRQKESERLFLFLFVFFVFLGAK